MKKPYLVRDPKHAYDVSEVQLLAEDEEDARIKGCACICGCCFDEVDDVVAGQICDDLIVVENPIVITHESVDELQSMMGEEDYREVSRALEVWRVNLQRAYPE